MTVTAMPKTETDEQKKPRSKKKLIIAIAVIVVLLGAGAYFVLKPGGSKTPAKPQPGTVLKLDSIQINLAGGHYLRLGLALQETKSAAADIDGSKALDAAISLFSGQSLSDLNQGQPRNNLKAKLAKQLSDLYDGDVMGVYFTEFVTQ